MPASDGTLLIDLYPGATINMTLTKRLIQNFQSSTRCEANLIHPDNGMLENDAIISVILNRDIIKSTKKNLELLGKRNL